MSHPQGIPVRRSAKQKWQATSATSTALCMLPARQTVVGGGGGNLPWSLPGSGGGLSTPPQFSAAALPSSSVLSCNQLWLAICLECIALPLLFGSTLRFCQLYSDKILSRKPSLISLLPQKGQMSSCILHCFILSHSSLTRSSHCLSSKRSESVCFPPFFLHQHQAHCLAVNNCSICTTQEISNAALMVNPTWSLGNKHCNLHTSTEKWNYNSNIIDKEPSSNALWNLT